MITHADRNKRQGRLSLASLIVSILALITSITGPFIAYYWLQGTLRLYELKRSAFSAEGIIEMGGEDCPGVPKTNTKTASYLLHLANSGGLPIEKVRVSIDRRFSLVKGRLKVIDPDPKVIKSLPPMSLEIEKHNQGVLVSFKDAIPPQNHITLALTENSVLDKKVVVEHMAPSVWVSSEVSGEYVSWDKAEIWERDCP